MSNLIDVQKHPHLEANFQRQWILTVSLLVAERLFSTGHLSWTLFKMLFYSSPWQDTDTRVFQAGDTQMVTIAVADTPPPRGLLGRQHTISPNFPKNCMKFKEFGPLGRRTSLASPLDPPLINASNDSKSSTFLHVPPSGTTLPLPHTWTI